ncbi:tripartite tricarboxylate transporter substrate-binding protein, partial [Acinetobacter baumannii]|nr:tripartite tricarboxylate transporter substrate-binding protein [Acinetobacter baumannii]MCW1766401.1 tripartite tricarboxylate transporter substrate-binding protein [Acinetobacter baumannii]
HVAYKGGGPAMMDVMSGQVPLMFASMGSAWQHVKTGKLRAVAVGGLERSKAAPELPTIAESGVPGYETYEWNAIFAPAGTPPAIVRQLQEASTKAVRLPEVQKHLKLLGASVTEMDQGRFPAQIASELQRNKALLDKAGVKPE